MCPFSVANAYKYFVHVFHGGTLQCLMSLYYGAQPATKTLVTRNKSCHNTDSEGYLALMIQ